MAMGIRNAALSIEYSTGKKENAGQQLKKDRCATYTVLVWVQHCTRYTAAIHIWLAITLANGVPQAGNRIARARR